MKQCPKCRTNYADDTLRFCLEDGTPLIDLGEDPTVVRPSNRESYDTEILPANNTTPGGGATRVDIPTSPERSTTPITVQAYKSDFPWTKLVVAVLAIGLIVVIGAGLLGVAFYVGSRKNETVITPTPPPRSTQTPDDEKKRLEDENAKLKKKLEESSGANSNDEEFDFSNIPNFGGTAEVNSPKDGFLALRNLPNVQYGSVIAKIPHRTTINILMCSEDSVSIDSRSGHWCMVSYNDEVGWVFDAWLIKNTRN